MNLDYKNSEDSVSSFSKEDFEKFTSITDKEWLSPFNEADEAFSEDEISSLLQDFNILDLEGSPPEDIVAAISDINNKLNRTPALIKHIEFPPSTIALLNLCISDRIIENEAELDKEAREVINTALNLLKFFIYHLPLSEEFLSNQIDTLIINYIKSPYLTYQNAADFIEIMAYLVSTLDDTRILPPFIDGLASSGFISTICDIFSFLHSQKNSRRKREPLDNLPYKSIGINLQHDVLIFPVLLFAFEYFKAQEKIGSTDHSVDDDQVPNYEDLPNAGNSAVQYNVTEELIEDLLAMLTLDLPERETCLLLNTLARVSLIFNRYYQHAIKAIGVEIFNLIVKYATLEFDGQEYALQIIINTIVYDENLEFVLNTDICEAIFTVIHQEPIEMSLLIKLLMTIQFLAYTIGDKKHFLEFPIFSPENIVETLQLRFIYSLFMDGSYDMRHYCSMIFINLLKNPFYHLPILSDPEINIIEMFASFFLTGQKKFCNFARNTLLDIIRNEQNRFILEPLYQVFMDQGVFDAFDDPDSSDINIYKYIMEIKGNLESELGIEEEE